MSKEIEVKSATVDRDGREMTLEEIGFQLNGGDAAQEWRESMEDDIYFGDYREELIGQSEDHYDGISLDGLRCRCVVVGVDLGTMDHTEMDHKETEMGRSYEEIAERALELFDPEDDRFEEVDGNSYWDEGVWGIERAPDKLLACSFEVGGVIDGCGEWLDWGRLCNEAGVAHWESYSFDPDDLFNEGEQKDVDEAEVTALADSLREAEDDDPDTPEPTFTPSQVRAQIVDGLGVELMGRMRGPRMGGNCIRLAYGWRLIFDKVNEQGWRWRVFMQGNSMTDEFAADEPSPTPFDAADDARSVVEAVMDMLDRVEEVRS